MIRHFLGLFLLIVATLAVVSWAQDRFLQPVAGPEVFEDRYLELAAAGLTADLGDREIGDRIAALRRASGLDLEIYRASDIAGGASALQTRPGEIAHMRAAGNEWWSLRPIGAERVLVLKTQDQHSARTPGEWSLTGLFYAAIALVLMIWLWPLTRDLRRLERAASTYGNRNWTFDAPIGERSQVHRLATTFRRMATRIDGLIASHRDMSNAVSHEIKTPLARMRFEIEIAQQSGDPDTINRCFAHLRRDITAVDELISATLEYAILERAGVELKLAPYDFTTLLQPIADQAAAERATGVELHYELGPGTTDVVCDLHLMEAALRNLVQNAARYARREVRISLAASSGEYHLTVDDDGPGIPAGDRARVFNSFVQLQTTGERHGHFGLGLAIVRRAFEWHGGDVEALDSPLGGARFHAHWPLPRRG